MTEKIIDEKSLEKVSGGAAGDQPDAKEREFELAWSSLKMEENGHTGTELEDVYAQWQRAGYKPDAKTFIRNCKLV